MYGIYAASRMLRHVNIRVTAQHYLDTKERTPIGLGNSACNAGQCDADRAKRPRQSGRYCGIQISYE